MKLWLDVETGSINHKKGAMLEIALVPEIDGVIGKPFVSKIKPRDGLLIEDGALKVNGIKRDTIALFPPEQEVADKLVRWITELDQKFTLAGHNCIFDKKFLYAFLGRNGHADFFIRTFRPGVYCTLVKARGLSKHLKCKMNLGALCSYFGVDIGNAHTALDDILATIKVNDHLEAMESPSQELVETKESNAEKRLKYMNGKYIMINGDGSVYISENTTQDKEAFKFIMNELWELYGV